MEEVRLYPGESIDDAYREMKKYRKQTGETCFVHFNSAILYSYDSRNTCYIKVTGKSKKEFDKYRKEELRRIKRKERLFKDRIPKLIKEYRKKARGIIAQEYLDVWDNAVPIRLNDLYHGWDLKCMLELVQVLNREDPEEDRFKACKELLENQEHSGCSYNLVSKSLASIHKDGEKFIEYLKKEVQ